MLTIKSQYPIRTLGISIFSIIQNYNNYKPDPVSYRGRTVVIYLR